MISDLDKTYNFTKIYISKNGYSPSVREISEYLGGISLSKVSTYLNKLSDDNRITWESKKARTISIVKNSKNCTFSLEYNRNRNIDKLMLLEDKKKLEEKLLRKGAINVVDNIKGALMYIDILLERLGD